MRAELAVAQSSMRAFQTEMNRAATVARKAGDDMSFAKVAQSAAQFEQARGSVAKLTQEFDHASKAAQGLSLASSGATRELIVLAHEMSQGNFSRFGGSMMVLAERAGGLHEMLGGLSGTMVAVSGAALLVGGSVAYLAYQAYEAKKNLMLLNAELNLTGRGNISTTDLDKSANALADKWGVTEAVALSAINEIAKASRGLSFDQIKMVADMAAAEAKFRNVPLADVAAEYKIKDAAAAIALANSYGLVTTAAERMLKNGDAFGAMNSALQVMKENIDKHGGAWAAARAKFDTYQSSVSALALADPEGMVPRTMLGAEPANPGRNPPTGAGTREWMAQWMAEHGVSPNAQKAIGGNASVESGFNSKAENASGHKGFFQWDASRWAAGGSPADDAGKQMELMLREIEQRIPGFTKSNAPVADLTRQFEQKFEISGGAMMPQRLAAAESFQPATGPNAPEQEKAQREAANEAEKVNQQARAVANRHSLEQQLEDAKAHAVEVARINKDEGLAAKDASQATREAMIEVAQKQAQLYDQDTKLYIDGLKAKQAATRDYAEKLRIQEQITGYRQQRGGSSLGGGVDKTAVAQDAIERANLEREQSREAIQTRIQSNDRLRTLDEISLQGFIAGERLKVVRGQETKEQELKNEQVYGDRLLAQQAARLERLAATAGLSSQEVARLSDGLAKIKVEQATKLAENLEKQAENLKAVADKWAAPFKSAFDSIGSTLESSISGLLDRSKTLGQVWADLGKSATSALINTAGSVLSKTAAGFVPGSKPGEGFGEAAGNLASNWLGKQISSTFNIGDVAKDAALSANTIAITANTAALGVAAGASAAGGAGSALGAAGSAGGFLGGLMKVGGFVADLFGQPEIGIPLAMAGSAVGSNPGGGTGGLYSRGGIVKAANGYVVPSSAANQNWAIGSDSVRALLTPGEVVLPVGERPSAIADRLHGAINDLAARGGDTNVHIHPTFHGPMDGPAIGRWFDDNHDHLARNVKRAVRGLGPRGI